jgi:Tfp pilus assembly protein PilX
MLFHALGKSIRCQRGIALPMAMLTLLILSALIIAFSMMASSEPVLANNQLQVAQARAIAESGIERAIWALNNKNDPNGIQNNGDPTYPMGGATASAPYDDTVAIPVMTNGTQVGVYTVKVTQGLVVNERVITATGWYPTNAGPGPKVKQVIQVKVLQSLFSGNPPPSALTVRGEISAGGNSMIDSRSDLSCGAKAGTYSEGATTISGSAGIYGADGNNIPYHTGDVNSGDAVQNVSDSTFLPLSYSNADLNALKAIAKAKGTYYQGTVSFHSGNQLPDGVIYVDTTDGQNIDINGPNTTDPATFASVDIHGNAPGSSDGIFHGVIIVAGTLSISGNFQMHGLVYTVNDFNYTGTGTGQIVGGVVSRNIRDTSTTSIDTNTGGNADIIWKCSYVTTGGGYVPPSFVPESSTYKEIPS